jgi:hypothetical protein
MGNGFAERLIGFIRREWLDNVIVFSEAHLRRVPTRLTTMNEPIARWTKTRRCIAQLSIGNLQSHLILGGLHQQ